MDQLRIGFVFCIFFLVLSGAGCISSQVEVTATTILPTSTTEVIPTSTKIWFPPTPTPRILSQPQASPTPELLNDLGSMILQDTFNDRDLWDTSRTEKGSILYGKDELTFAISGQNTILTSFLKSEPLEDFYLELTANPSLCRNADMYGVLFRVSSPLDYYRLSVNCNGELRLDVIRDGRTTVLQQWITSSQVPPGSPLIIRLGIWVSGAEKRIFVNDIFQFSFSDSVWPSGTVGLFARTSQGTALTVNFSNLTLRSIE